MAKQTKKKTVTLTKSDKLYIENNSKLNISELAEDTGKTQNIIKEYLAELRVKSGIKVDDLMAKRKGGTVVMTESASSLADDKKQDMKPPTDSKPRQFIHKIRD